MKTVFTTRDITLLYRHGFTLNYVISHAQPFIGFYSAYSTVKGSTTMQDVYEFALGREQDAIEYIEEWYTSEGK